MTEHQSYVLCYAHPRPHQWWPEVLLIEKKRPQWQAGKYNLPGGHVEPGESIHVAANRELWEETGISCGADNVRLLGVIEVPNATVNVCHCEFDSLRGKNVIETKTDEEVFWMPFDEAFREPKLIGNLRVILPLLRSGLCGWSLTETEETVSIVYSDNANSTAA